MIAFEVNDMTCGHCVSTITKALKSVDNHARFTIDQTKRLVTIESADADPKALQDAIEDAGYTPTRVEEGTIEAPDRTKSCCGDRQ
ncbi:heavy-metal-associated domain-containing protein [Trinickia violacea]|uniref:Heavy-metal-associated domain-containing protein n=1 Tax=Trinickia violacea TaxID=2571746 RepID=A0A4P8J1U7_9BURK|nr:heavy-metal-associated domain-containing protein [Trinickia violacea]QCP54345.1 heavy-metal-associated domain-containing protein [Trinickia violacea]